MVTTPTKFTNGWRTRRPAFWVQPVSKYTVSHVCDIPCSIADIAPVVEFWDVFGWQKWECSEPLGVCDHPWVHRWWYCQYYRDEEFLLSKWLCNFILSLFPFENLNAVHALTDITAGVLKLSYRVVSFGIVRWGAICTYLSITSAITTAKLMERRVMPRSHMSFGARSLNTSFSSAGILFPLQLSQKYSAWKLGTMATTTTTAPLPKFVLDDFIALALSNIPSELHPYFESFRVLYTKKQALSLSLFLFVLCFWRIDL